MYMFASKLPPAKTGFIGKTQGNRKGNERGKATKTLIR